MSASPTYDVAIIGAGPAGGSAAVRLAEAGARTVVIERESLPRPKACGGALSKGPVESVLDWDFGSVVAARGGSLRYSFDHGRVVEQTRDRPILFVERASFDLHIVERALSLCPSLVSLRDGCGVARVEPQDGQVGIHLSSGERLSARYVIGADGVAGPTRRSLGLARAARPSPAIDVEIELDGVPDHRLSDEVRFDFGCVDGGYAWVFPKGDHVAAGVASWGRGAKVNDALDRFLQRTFPEGAIRTVRRRAHPIPLYGGREALRHGRVLLAGDAASLVDPYLGEGIRYAVKSGDIAARYVVAALADGPQALDGYDGAVDAAMGRDLDAIRTLINPLLVRAPELFYRSFVEQGGSMDALIGRLGGSAALQPY